MISDNHCRAQADRAVIRRGLDDDRASEHRFDGLHAAVKEAELAPGVVVREVLTQIAFGARGGDTMDDHRTLDIDELPHLGDKRRLPFRGEQDGFPDWH